MGEYFKWVNADRQEYLDPDDFHEGCRAHQTMANNSATLQALQALLCTQWQGDRVIWLGDYAVPEKNGSSSIVQTLCRQALEYGYGENIEDLIFERYRNVSCCFADIKQEFTCCIEDGRNFKYILNLSKKIYCAASGKQNPLPLLLGLGETIPAGAWVDDIVAVSDELPEGFTEAQSCVKENGNV